MKKTVIGVAGVLALLLVAAPWGIGRIAESRVDRGLEQFVAAAPYLRIVDRDYVRGWFRSAQRVTFEFVAPGQRLPVDGLADGSPGAPQRFTVRNEILHGPVLWADGVGVANVHTRIDWSADARALFVRTLGSEDPLRIATRIGFFGGRRTTFLVEGRELAPEPGVTVSWDDLSLAVTYTSDLDSIAVSGRWPRFESVDAQGSRQLIEDMTIEGDSDRIENDLYDGDVDFCIGAVASETSAGKTRVEDISYVVEAEEEGEFVDVSFAFGTGDIATALVNVPGGKIDEAHADFALRRLDTQSLSRLVTAMKQSYADPLEDADAVREAALRVFAKDPELVVERVGFSAADGHAYLEGVVRFRGVVPEDLAIGGLGLVAKAEAKLEFVADAKLLRGLPAGEGAVDQMVQSGFLREAGGKLLSTIELVAGDLKINGKAQGIPGLGAPPPVGGTEGPPPQE